MIARQYNRLNKWWFDKPKTFEDLLIYCMKIGKDKQSEIKRSNNHKLQIKPKRKGW